jgi:cytochrome P450
MSSTLKFEAASPNKPLLPERGRAVAQAPGLRQRWRLPYGALRQARGDPLWFYTQAARRYGDVFRWDIGSLTFHLLSHPDHVKRVLLDRVENYPRSRFYNVVRLATGNGLVVSEGPHWRQQRRLVQPAFHRQRIAALDVLMTTAIGRMLDGWEGHAASGAELNVGEEMMRLALRIVGEALFSRDVSAETAELGRAVTVAMQYVAYRIQHVLAAPLVVPTRRNRQFQRARTTVDRLVYQMIRERRAEPAGRDDLLGMLLAARDEQTGEQMSAQEVRDEAVTFLAAGHETTAVALTWTWYLISRHPEVERRLRAEIGQVLGGRLPTSADLPRLRVCRMAIEESMRLYPPVWMMSRGVVADDAVDGYRIPAGSVVLVSQYVTHRHPEFWPNPEGFDPDRFSPEQSASRPRFAYIPFAGGPHSCIGSEFAMMEAVLAVAMTLQRFRLQLVPGHPVVPDPIFTLRPKHGVFAVVKSVAHSV